MVQQVSWHYLSHITFNRTCARWLEKAKIIPIHKSGDTASPSNYRPISLTSTSCKILEHIILKHLTTYFEENGILTANQHGFRHGMSTVTQLTEVIHDLAQTIDNRGQTDIIFLDFSKAFDCVCHNKLIAKLESIIGNGSITAWTRDFYHNVHSSFSMMKHHLIQFLSHLAFPRARSWGPYYF